MRPFETPAVRYATPRTFARALADRLKRQAAEEGVDLDRLRKRITFERFLARLFEHGPSRWVLKGGYALELRLGGKARASKDIDLDLPPPPMEDLLDELQEADELPPAAEMRRTIEATFDRYGTHALSDPLPDPPAGWKIPFEAAAEELGLETAEIDLAHRRLQGYLRSVIAG